MRTMSNRLLLLLSLFVLLGSAGCAKRATTDSLSRSQSPTLTDPVGHERLDNDWPIYMWFDPL
jgi:hypothetical protein